MSTTTQLVQPKTELKDFLRDKSAKGGNSVIIDAKDFLKQLAALDAEEEFHFYTRENSEGQLRGHFQFLVGDTILPVSISPAGIENMPREMKKAIEKDANPMEVFTYCLKNCTLRSGIGNTEEQRPYLSFGVLGEGNRRTGTLDLKKFIKEWS